MRTNVPYDHHSEIKGLSTFHAAFTAFTRAQLTGYSTGENKVDRKLTNYQSGSAPFAMVNKSRNCWPFSAHLLPFLEIYFCFDPTQIYVLAGFSLIKINDGAISHI